MGRNIIRSLKCVKLQIPVVTVRAEIQYCLGSPDIICQIHIDLLFWNGKQSSQKWIEDRNGLSNIMYRSIVETIYILFTVPVLHRYRQSIKHLYQILDAVLLAIVPQILFQIFSMLHYRMARRDRNFSMTSHTFYIQNAFLSTPRPPLRPEMFCLDINQDLNHNT